MKSLRLSPHLWRDIALLATAFGAISSVVAPRGHAASLLQNGDFTEVMPGGVAAPSGWDAPKDTKPAFARDTETFRSAPASLRVNGGGISQAFDAPKSGAFTLAGFSKTQGEVTQLKYDLQVFGANWNQIAWITSEDNDANKLRASDDWQGFSRDVQLPEGAAHVILYFNATGTGQAWLDDVSVMLPLGPDVNADADKLAIGVSAPVKVLAATPYRYGNAIMGGVEYATSIIFNPKRPALMYSRNDTGSIYQFDRKRERWVSLMDTIPWKWSNLFVADSFAVDANRPGTIYVAAGGSRWDSLFDVVKTIDNGKTWTRLNLQNERGEPVRSEAGGSDKPAGERLQVDPNDSNSLWFGTRFDGLLRSSDAGKTWARVTSLPSKGGARDGLTFVTLDWKATKIGATQTLYVGSHAGREGDDEKGADVPGGVYRSRDGGQSWQLLNGANSNGPDQKSSPMRGRVGADGTLYVSFSGGAGLWKFAGETWTDITPPNLRGKPFSGIGLHPTDPKQILTITFDDRVIPYSRDGGQTWTDYAYKPDGSGNIELGFQPPWETVNRDYQWPTGYAATIEFDPLDPTRVYETDFSGANLLTGIGTPRAKVSLLSEGREQMTMGDVLSPSAGAPLISGAWDIGGFRHVNLKAIPNARLKVRQADNSQYTGYDAYRNGFQDVFQLDANAHNPNVIVAAGGWQWNNTGAAAISTDNGETFRVMSQPFPDAKFGRIAISRDSQNIVWAPMGTENTPLYFSIDGGKSWTASQGAPLGTVATQGPWSFYKMLAADRETPGVFYLYDRRDGRFYRSQDGGTNWKHVSTLPKQEGAHYDLNRVLAVPGKPGVVWCSLKDQGLFTSQNGGDSWTKVANISWAHAFSFGIGKPGSPLPAAYLFGQINGAPTSDKDADLQLYRSDDLGQTWTRINDSTHQFAGFNSMAGDNQQYGRVYVSTGGRGVFYGVPAR